MRSTWTLALGAALGLAWLALSPPAAAQGDPAQRLAGTWEGQVAFVTGHRARVELTLERGAGDGYGGSYVLTPLGEEGPETPTTGAVTAAPDAQGLVIVLAGQPDVRARALVGDPGSHAELALYGVFQGGDAGEGTFMLWRYRRR